MFWPSGHRLNFASSSIFISNKAEADLHHLEKLGWHVPQHWHPDDTVTLDGFMLLYNMLWAEHDNEHIRVLLKFVKTQWALRHDTVFHTEAQEYRNWMNAALYRTLKKDETPYARPFQRSAWKCEFSNGAKFGIKENSQVSHALCRP